MIRVIRVLAALALLAGTSVSQASIITANLEDVTNGGGFFGVITIEDTATDQVRITADISSPINAGITQGDILGLWFDFATLSPGSIGASGDVFGGQLCDNCVGNSLGGNVNINGSGTAGWDLGLITGQNGSAGGFNQTVTILLSALGLSASEFDGQRMGMRVQSIAGVADFGGSSKLRGVGSPPVSIPEPGTLGLLGLGLMGLGLLRRKRAV